MNVSLSTERKREKKKRKGGEARLYLANMTWSLGSGMGAGRQGTRLWMLVEAEEESVFVGSDTRLLVAW